MRVAVWDTYVIKNDGSLMHFDIIVPSELEDQNIIFEFGRKYLATKDVKIQTLTSKECTFCHTEVIKPEWESKISAQGHFIYEMENCND